MIKDDEQRIKVGAEMPASVYKMLLDVCKWYRTNNVSHGLRMLIEDAWKGIQQDDPISRLKPTTGAYKGREVEEVLE